MISTRTAAGPMCQITAMCGRLTWAAAGLPIVMAAGSGTPTTDGRGFPTNRGAGLLIIMVAGCITTTPGAGGRVRFIPLIGPYGDLPGCRFLASDLAAGISALA